MQTPQREAVGTSYDATLMRRARERSWAVLEGIRARMQPGTSEAQAQAIAAEVFAVAGVERLWHRPYIRIGANTLKTYRLWVLEIQIAHPSEPFGAFYEDLLSSEPAA